MRTSVRWPGPSGDLEITLHFSPVEGRYECVGVDVRSFRWTTGEPRKLPNTEPRAIKTEELRLPLAELADSERAKIRAFLFADTGDAEWDETPWASGQVEAWEPKKQGRPPKYDLNEVSRVYREAYDKNKKPTRAVAAHFGISESNAANQVARCRDPEIGLLPPTTRGRQRAVEPNQPKRKGKKR
jgi:hypothetical protein